MRTTVTDLVFVEGDQDRRRSTLAAIADVVALVQAPVTDERAVRGLGGVLGVFPAAIAFREVTYTDVADQEVIDADSAGDPISQPRCGPSSRTPEEMP
jgi:hypothetical protein